MRIAPALLVALSLALAPLAAQARCVFSGAATVRGLRVAGTNESLTLSQRMEIDVVGATARVRGFSPIAFAGTAPIGNVALFLREPRRSGLVVGVGAGTSFRASHRAGESLVGALREPSGMVVRGVSIPCSSLSTEPTGTPRSAPVPSHWTNPRYISHTTSREEFRCTRGRWGVGCVPVSVGWCQPVGDGSECGYHPLARALTVFAAPSDGIHVARVSVEASRDILFADESRRGGWILVRSYAPSQNSVVVRGWVRASDVRWRQEVRPCHRGVGRGMVGTAGSMTRGATRGMITVPVGSAVMDAAGHPWGTTTAVLRGEGTQLPGSSAVSTTLPWAAEALSAIYFAAAVVRWESRRPP